MYDKYRLFSDKPSKAKNFCCQLKFKEPINFNQKFMKEAIKQEIRKMLEDDKEYSQSPYTNPVVAIQKNTGKVCLCLDAHELTN